MIPTRRPLGFMASRSGRLNLFLTYLKTKPPRRQRRCGADRTHRWMLASGSEHRRPSPLSASYQPGYAAGRWTNSGRGNRTHIRAVMSRTEAQPRQPQSSARIHVPGVEGQASMFKALTGG